MTTLHHRTTPPDAPAHDPDGPAAVRAGSPTTEPEKDSAKEPKEPARLSLTQIVASGLAAVSTTVLLSLFGVAGTIIGAGLASVLTVVANFLYTRSIEKTHAQLKPVVGTIQAKTATARLAQPGGRRRDTAVLGAAPAASSAPTATVPPPADAGAPAEASAAERRDDEAGPPPRNAWLRLVEKHGRGRVLAVSSLAVFLVVMGVVLVVELALGKPLSDAVRGQEGTGTSISQLRHTTPAGSGTTDQDQAARDRAGREDDGAEGTTSGGTDAEQEPATDGGSTATDDGGSSTDQGGAATSDPTDPATQEPTTDPTREPSDPATGGTDTGDTATGGTGSGEDADGGTDTGTETGTGTEDGTSTGDGQVGSSGGTAGDTSDGTESSGEPTPTPETSGSTTG